MEQLNLTVPYEHIRPLVQLTWREVRFGLDEGLFAARDAIRLATDRLAEGDTDNYVAELSLIGWEDSVRRVVDQLADEEPKVAEQALQRVWAFLALSWVEARRDEFDDPLDIAEKLYADLGHPQQVRFIRYLPPQSAVLGDAALYDEWQSYLRSEREHFAAWKRVVVGAKS